MPPPLLGTATELTEQTNTSADHRYTEKDSQIDVTGHRGECVSHELNGSCCTSFNSFHEPTSSGFCQDTHL